MYNSKFEIGNIVYYFDDQSSKIIGSKIKSHSIYIEASSTYHYYTLENYAYKKEDKLFSTEEEAKQEARIILNQKLLKVS